MFDKKGELLDTLSHLTGMEKDEVILEALTLYGYAIAEARKGKSIATVDTARNVYTVIELSKLLKDEG